MSTGLSIAAALWLLASAGQTSNSEAWRAIVPLESTREDVIRLLGSPLRGSSGELAVYETDSAKVTVEFARVPVDDETCIDRLPEGTVLSVRWRPNRPVPESSLENELGELTRSRGKEEFDAFEILHDESRGIVAQVIDGEVEWILYLSPEARGGRCSTFYSSDPLEYLIEPIVGHVYAVCSFAKLDQAEVRSGDSVGITMGVHNPGADPVTFEYVVTGGRIVGSGAQVCWDTSGLAPGKYTVLVFVSDGYNPPSECSATLTVRLMPQP